MNLVYFIEENMVRCSSMFQVSFNLFCDLSKVLEEQGDFGENA
jgi:hypothetical protein